MKGLFGNVSLLSTLTILSRFLGLARDILLFSAFGASLYGEAFILAFTMPNLFRRMLGEGTLSSAFIPIYAETIKTKSLKVAQSLLDRVISRLGIFLLGMTVVVCLFSYGVSESIMDEKWSHAAGLNTISFGYVAFICCAAIATGALNSHGRFFAGGFSPIILNMFMILTLSIFGIWKEYPLDELAIFLSFSVLIAGAFQLLLPFEELKRKFDWKMNFNLTPSLELSKINQIFWVGALGAAVVQVNILVSRFLAFSLDETGALSYLFLSSRLVELPLGVFAISISTVLFPELSKSASQKDHNLFALHLFRGLRMTSAITIPAAVGLIILAEPILSILFNWGMFGQNEVLLAAEVLVISACGLPFYAVSTFLVKGFHSKQNMRVPLQAAILSMSSNIFFSLLLMESLGVHGLAWANVIAAVAQSFLLYWKTSDLKWSSLFKKDQLYMPSILISSCLMALLLFSFKDWSPLEYGKGNDLVRIAGLIPLGVLTYFCSLFLAGLPEVRNLMGSFKPLRKQ